MGADPPVLASSALEGSSVTAMTVIDSRSATAPPVDACVAAGTVHPRPDGQDRHTISEVATLIGISAHTLRRYEQIGLLPRVARSPAGQRLFDNDDLVRDTVSVLESKTDFSQGAHPAPERA